MVEKEIDSNFKDSIIFLSLISLFQLFDIKFEFEDSINQQIYQFSILYSIMLIYATCSL